MEQFQEPDKKNQQPPKEFLDAIKKFKQKVKNEKWTPRKITDTFWERGDFTCHTDPQEAWNSIIRYRDWTDSELEFFALRELIENGLMFELLSSYNSGREEDQQ